MLHKRPSFDQNMLLIVIKHCSFTQDGVKVNYTIYNVTEYPSSLFGTLGDVATDGDMVWFREKDVWIFSSKQVDDIGRPIQSHPIFKNKRRLDGVEWKSQTTWNNNIKKRKLNENENEGRF